MGKKCLGCGQWCLAFFNLPLVLAFVCAWLASPCGHMPWPRLALLALAIVPPREVNCGKKVAWLWAVVPCTGHFRSQGRLIVAIFSPNGG